MRQLIKRLPHRTTGRTFVVGDLHGCWDQLMFLLEAAKFDFDKDLLLGSGDYVNRGSKSEQCASLPDMPWFEGVAGNHEEEVVRAAFDPTFNWDNFIAYGGLWARNLPHERLIAIAEKFAMLPVVLVIGEGANRYNVFHAEFHGSDEKLDAIEGMRKPPIYLQYGEELIEGRVRRELHDGLSTSYVGHRIGKEIRRIGSHVYLDTGAFKAERRANSPYGLSMIEPATGLTWKYNN